MPVPNPTIAHYRVGCAYKLFLFQSDQQKGLDEALKACFPDNHHCYCAVHIRRNVEGRHGKKIGVLVPGLAKTTSLPVRDAKLAQLQLQSPGAYDYLIDIPAKQWMDCAWREDETLPPRYEVQSSNISESANSMLERERSRNWLGAIDGILKKMSLRIKASREKYKGKTSVVERVYPQILDPWEKRHFPLLPHLGSLGHTPFVNAGLERNHSVDPITGQYFVLCDGTLFGLKPLNETGLHRSPPPCVDTSGPGFCLWCEHFMGHCMSNGYYVHPYILFGRAGCGHKGFICANAAAAIPASPGTPASPAVVPDLPASLSDFIESCSLAIWSLLSQDKMFPDKSLFQTLPS
ncbi:transposase, mutator family protein [Nitzschia inconspicua]|uniref:Transposase, mutator family protein n=1 Tax=Nitzschia inconspicua TaxID=303405 RepID=A0A9K3LI63_9STRA|nr:transposase, mutator family protein [Nitzschia inconspicua]KAG7361416.1 transposase, mutator family protein [Nitzschia inconspicua]